MSLIRFATRMKQYRELQNPNLTQEQVAEILGVTKQTISNYENSRTSPKLEDLEEIALKMGVSEAWLLGVNVTPNDDALSLVKDAYILDKELKTKETVNGKSLPVLSKAQAEKALEITARALDLFDEGKISEETLNTILKK